MLKAVASPHPPQVGCCPATNPVLYYKVMTPQWLQDHATLNHLIAASPTSLHFRPSQQYARLISCHCSREGTPHMTPLSPLPHTLKTHPQQIQTFTLPSVCKNSKLCANIRPLLKTTHTMHATMGPLTAEWLYERTVHRKLWCP